MDGFWGRCHETRPTPKGRLFFGKVEQRRETRFELLLGKYRYLNTALTAVDLRSFSLPCLEEGMQGFYTTLAWSPAYGSSNVDG